MKAMILTQPGQPLTLAELPDPKPGPGQLLLQVQACGVCRTDVHIADGELVPKRFPLVQGHQIVGTVLETGDDENSTPIGSRVGVPWLGWTDGKCYFCRTGNENLCDHALFTGFDIDGGFAELAVADARYCFPIPEGFPDLQAAPLLCAGMIGYRAYRMSGKGERLGLYGFGAAAHIITQVAIGQGKQVFAFTRPEDTASQEFAIQLGATWAGSAQDKPPAKLDNAIIFAPVGELVPQALRAVRKGGSVICAGIHMSDIPSFPYEDLWGERIIRSVANLTRRDGQEFLELMSKIPVHTTVKTYALSEINQALTDIRTGELQGAAVVTFNKAKRRQMTG